MFGRRYFGGRYFGPRYWGDGGAAVAPPPLATGGRRRKQIQVPYFEPVAELPPLVGRGVLVSSSGTLCAIGYFGPGVPDQRRRTALMLLLG